MKTCPVCKTKRRSLLEVTITIYKNTPEREFLCGASGPAAIICRPCLDRMSFGDVATEAEEQERMRGENFR